MSAPAAERWWVFVTVLTVVLLLYSTLGLPPAWYVPVNLLATAGLLLVARRVGMTAPDLAVEPSRFRSGLRWGLVAGLGIAGVLVVGAAIPATRPLFDDARTAGIGPALLAYRALVRIPLGTALLEEVAFRGVLFGAWQRVAAVRTAAAASSLVFGLWHVRPVLDLLAENDVAANGPERILAVIAAVLGTTIAGIAFCWLRMRSRSLVAPFVAHTVVNSLATLAAYVV